MTFKLQPDQVEKAWATLKIEVVFAPQTGNIKPWEVYGVFTFPHPMRKHWASFKTEAAARKRAAALREKYPQANGEIDHGTATRRTVD